MSRVSRVILWVTFVISIILLGYMAIMSRSRLNTQEASDFEIQRFFAIVDLFSNVTVVSGLGVLFQMLLGQDKTATDIPSVTKVIVTDKKTNTEIEIEGIIAQIKIK